MPAQAGESARNSATDKVVELAARAYGDEGRMKPAVRLITEHDRSQAERVGSGTLESRPDGDVIVWQHPNKREG